MAPPALDPDALPIVLRQRPLTKFKALVLGAWFVFLGGVGMALALGRGAAGSDDTRAAGVAIAVAAAPFALYWVLQLVPRSCRLRVGPDGFDVRHCFVRRKRAWNDVGRFYVRSYEAPSAGTWEYDGVAFTRAGAERAGVASLLDQLRVRGILDSDLLPDTYGVRPKELARFLNGCRERAVGGRTPTCRRNSR